MVVKGFKCAHEYQFEEVEIPIFVSLDEKGHVSGGGRVQALKANEKLLSDTTDS